MKIFNNIETLKWFYAILIVSGSFLAYADYTGWRILSFTNQETWSASGPSGHK